MKFEQALGRVRKGHYIRRPHWPAEQMLGQGDSLCLFSLAPPTADHPCGSASPSVVWSPDVGAMLMDDWEIYEEPKPVSKEGT